MYTGIFCGKASLSLINFESPIGSYSAMMPFDFNFTFIGIIVSLSKNFYSYE